MNENNKKIHRPLLPSKKLNLNYDKIIQVVAVSCVVLLFLAAIFKIRTLIVVAEAGLVLTVIGLVGSLIFSLVNKYKK